MQSKPSQSEPDEIEYVGAPTELADAEEMPEWVSALVKLLYFWPAAAALLTTVPLLLLLGLVACLVLCLLVVLAL